MGAPGARARVLGFLAVAALLAGCAGGPPRDLRGATAESVALARPLRVACLGDSITAGGGAPAGVDGASVAWPAQLGRMLGPVAEVRNLGRSSRTLLAGADKPLRATELWTETLAWAPDVAIVVLGTNDTVDTQARPNWSLAGAGCALLEADAESLCRDLLAAMGARAADEPAAPAPRVLLCSPPPFWPEKPGLGSGRAADLRERAPRRAEVAAAYRRVAARVEGVEYHDLSRALTADQVTDGVHPTPFGQEQLAQRFHGLVVRGAGPACAPLQLDSAAGRPALAAALGAVPTTGEHHGFERVDWQLPGAGAAAILVRPHAVAPGAPWLWRMRFFGHEPALELELLDRGFHLAYVDVADLYGAPEALARMEELYGVLTGSLGLGARPALLGMSRGGLPALAWAAAHPERTAAVVLDNGVVDVRSWPGGATGKRSDADWAGVLRAWGWTEEQAAERGVDLGRRAVAAAGAEVPLLVVQAMADDVVPGEENGLDLARRWRLAGGMVELWPKPGGGHHPHGLHPPAPLARALERAVGLGVNPGLLARPSVEYRGSPAGWGGGTWTEAAASLRARAEELASARGADGVALVFLGDSITQGLTGHADRLAHAGGARPIDAVLGDLEPLSLGLSGDRTEHLLWRIERGALAVLDPEVVVLQVGVNDVNAAGRTGRELAEGVRAVVASLLAHEPQARVLVSGPFPAGRAPDDPRRAAIDTAHALIAELAAADRVGYLDPRPLFLDATGAANANLGGDGIHATPAGQRAWLEALEPTLRGLLAD